MWDLVASIILLCAELLENLPFSNENLDNLCVLILFQQYNPCS